VWRTLIVPNPVLFFLFSWVQDKIFVFTVPKGSFKTLPLRSLSRAAIRALCLILPARSSPPELPLRQPRFFFNPISPLVALAPRRHDPLAVFFLSALPILLLYSFYPLDSGGDHFFFTFASLRRFVQSTVFFFFSPTPPPNSVPFFIRGC